MSQNTEQEFVNSRLWNLFRSRFKSSTTEASYWSDIQEFCRFTGKAFSDTDTGDVVRYYEYLSDRTEQGKISPLTMTKKFRELHSFAMFCAGSEEADDQKSSEDHFQPYLKQMAKERRLARSIPVEDMDALLQAVSGNLMSYAILTLMYRAGLSSTEIINLDGEADFIRYDDGIYAVVKGRRELCRIPEDAWQILTAYMEQRDIHPSLFYNRSGRPLNAMYISRMMKKYCRKAGIQNYSAESIRNSCAFNLFAYGAGPEQVAEQMGRTERQIKRYKGISYRGNLRKHAENLVKMKIEKP